MIFYVLMFAVKDMVFKVLMQKGFALRWLGRGTRRGVFS